ncbi:MAG: Maf family protein [Porticoccaceae bacterium]|nr:Maf family protein [Porticoccaceae bacterium]MDG1311686.1 Maf family protein [Porticoccaceae bacterium]
MSNLILASGSPYRKMLLQRLGIEFSCYSPDIDESHNPDEAPRKMAERLAREKARLVAAKFPGAIVIGSDQVAELNGTALGKPGTHQRATQQLQAQSGQVVLFHTGLALAQQQPDDNIQEFYLVDTTDVSFRELSETQIDRYLKKEQPYDCAGSFKAEGLGISLFLAVQSQDPSSLIGLPLISLCSALRDFGLEIL